jgi:hypothetical protein
MAKQTFTDVGLLLDGYDLSSGHNQAALTVERDTIDLTSFGQLNRDLFAGFGRVGIAHRGWFEAGTGTVNDAYTEAMTAGNLLHTILPTGGAEGDPAYSLVLQVASYTPLSGAVAEGIAWSLDGAAQMPLVRGNVLHRATKSTTGTGTIFQLGAVGATQRIYAGLHLTALSGTGTPTITCRLESDDAVGFTTPTTRATFTARTAIGAELISAAGAITDTYWRLAWTVSGTGPSFTFTAHAGIL